MATSIVAAVASLLGIIWWVLKKIDKKNKKYEEALRDKKKAIAAHDFNAELDAERRMRLYKR